MTRTVSNKLVFLISQPRAGSTLLQKMLSCHPDIHTISEPWLMLHPIYALKAGKVEAEYGARIANRALNCVISSLPNQQEDYYHSLRQMYGYLYDCLLKDTNKSCFLDKTPRYYFIIDELHKVFPDARFIILLRNPIAVLCSIMSTWIGKELYELRHYENDLLKAPKLLTEGINSLEEKCIVVHYEKLLKNPKKQIGALLKHLQIEIDLSLTDYSTSTLGVLGQRGDKTKILSNTKPDNSNIDAWSKKLEDPQLWRLSRDYLEAVGSDTTALMGYSFEDMQAILKEKRPRKLSMLRSVSLERVLRP